MPAAWCQTHHVGDWAKGGRTDIDELTLACGPGKRLATDTGWTTVKNDGTTEWIPPPDQDRGQRRTNTYFHPDRYLRRDDEDEDKFDN